MPACWLRIVRTMLLPLLLLQMAPQVHGQDRPEGRTERPNNLSSNGTMPGVHLQRDRAYDAPAIIKPQNVVWKTEGLFVINDSYVTTATVQGMPGNPSINLKLPSFHNFTDPIIASGTLFFSIYTGDGYLFARDAATGKDKWNFKIKKFGITAPAVAGEVVFVGGNDGIFFALSATSGQELWRFKQKGSDFFTLGPVVNDGLVYFTSSEAGGGYARADGRIYALDVLTGQQKWLFKTKGSLSSPAIQNKMLYVGNSEGYLYAIDSESGLERWKFKAGKGVGAPAIMNGLVYFDDFDGNLFAVGADSGELKWKATKIPKTLYMLALANGVVYYVGAQNSVFAVDGLSGAVKWTYQTKKLCKPPVIAGGMLYFASFDGFLYAIDAMTGEERWKLESKNTVPSSPIIAGGMLFFLTADGHMYAVR